MGKRKGRVTIPTDQDVIQETLHIMERWGADAIRDCDGTDFPKALAQVDAKIYKTYYTTRKDNVWAKAHPEEVQQCYLMTAFTMAKGDTLDISLMKGISADLMQVNRHDDVHRWWEVMDRTTGEVFPVSQWTLDPEEDIVHLKGTTPYHEYTVSFLAYLIWDPVHMYNAVTNDWKDFEHQITFDVRQPQTKAYSMERLKRFCAKYPYVNVIRYTTFFHQFTLVFDELKREKFVDWYGYSASVSPYILEQFEKEVGYPFRPEYIIDQGFFNTQYRTPSPQFRDFMRFQAREVAKLAKEMVDLTHELGKEAMMFLGDHWIGTEPYLEDFQKIGLDAVVGSVGNGQTLRILADIPGVKTIEGRLLPYFFPDTFFEGGDPVAVAKENWITARRAILRAPIDRIGYGGYLKLALKFPDFVDYVTHVCEEFRDMCDQIQGQKPLSQARVAVLNSWGKMRSWGCHMQHHAIYHKENRHYAGVLEALSGAPLDVSFISFEDLLETPQILDQIDCLINVGDGQNGQTGGAYWTNPKITALLREYVAKGGAFLGVGEPSGQAYQGRYLQMAQVLGVEKETGETLGYDKYNKTIDQTHFIAQGFSLEGHDFGPCTSSIYALPQAKVLAMHHDSVQLAANEFEAGRAVYFAGLPYSFENAQLFLRTILWACHAEDKLRYYACDHPYVDVYAYPKTKRYCVVNHSEKVQKTSYYAQLGEAIDIELKPYEMLWFDMKD